MMGPCLSRASRPSPATVCACRHDQSTGRIGTGWRKGSTCSAPSNLPSPEILLFVVPTQRLGVRPPVSSSRSLDRLAMQGIVMPAVFELFFNAAAHLKCQLWRHGHIAGVEEGVDVPAKQQAISG